VGKSVTVKLTPLLFVPPTFTTTLPVVAPEGTVTWILPLPHDVTVAVVPLKVTVLVPWVEPKLVPAMVTDVPTRPEVGERLLMFGVWARTSITPDNTSRTKIDNFSMVLRPGVFIDTTLQTSGSQIKARIYLGRLRQKQKQIF
jgi:hypothetical protein